MKIIRSVTINVTLTGSQPRDQTFQVLDSITYSNILLGRDFMKTFGSIRFDFTGIFIELGTLSISGLATTEKQVRLCKSNTIPVRSEKVLFAKCSTQNSLTRG